MNDRINVSFQRGQKRTLDSGQIEYSLEDAFSVLDKIKGTPRYWRQRKFILFAMLENLGPFSWFFTLSCADYRYEENFTSLLQDRLITYVIEDGVERCRIDGQTIEEFLSHHETQHEFIRKNTLTATRNFQHRLKMFVKNVIMNKFGPMHVCYHTWRIEFQLRGAAHCHGVLWIDMDKYLEKNKKATENEKLHLKQAYEHLMTDIIPSDKEESAVVSFVDLFVTCSLQEPISRDIALQVNNHRHSHTCRRYGGVCRFDFPRWPCLCTILAKPLRLTHDPDERQEVYEHLKLVLLSVRNVLENSELMEKLCEIGSEEIQALFNIKQKKFQIEKMLDDPKFKKEILAMQSDDQKIEERIGPLPKKKKKSEESIGKAHVENLEALKEMLDQQIDDFDIDSILKERLIAVLRQADLIEIMKIDKNQSKETIDDILLEKYHHLLSISTKGFCVRLKRDIAECYINNFSHEWISIWNSNMDLSPVFDFYATLCYIGEYVLKSDRGTTEFIIKALKEQNSKDRVEKIKTVSKAFLTHRQMGMCETYYRALPNLHLVGSNIGCEFLPTGMEKSKFLRKLEEEEMGQVQERRLIQIANRDGHYVETVSLNDKYKRRPPQLHNLTQIQFVKRYVSVKRVDEDKLDPEELVIGNCEDNNINQDYIICRDSKKRHHLPERIELTGEFLAAERQFMKLRRPVVVRLHKFKKDGEPHEYYFSELELFHIFESQEEEDLCREHLDICLAVYNANIDDINYIKSKTMPFLKLVEKGQEMVNEANIDKIGEEIDPENEQLDEDCAEEDVEHTDQFVSFDYDKDPTPPSAPTGLFKRIELGNIESLNKMTRELDEDQKFVIDQVIAADIAQHLQY